MTIEMTIDVTHTAYPTYDSYKDSGVDWLGEVPIEWTVERLGTLLNEVSRKNYPDLPLLSITRELGVIERNIEDRDSNHNFIPDDLSGYKKLEQGQFGMNKMKAWQGSYGVSPYTGIVSPAYYAFDIHPALDKNFFSLAIRSKVYISYFGSASDGVRIGQWDLNKTRMKQIRFAIPTLDEQKNIVSFLNVKMEQIDQAITLKQQQIAKLEEYKQIVIQNAVTKGLNPDAPMKDSGVDWIGEIPKHWEVKKLMFVTENFNKKVLSSESELPYIGMESIESKTGQLSDENSEAEGLASYFKKGQILFGKLRPYLAKVYLTDFEGLCSTEFMVMSVRSDILDIFLKYQLLSNRFIAQINSSTYGSKMPRASAEYVKRQSITLPPIEEQKFIVDHIDSITNKINQTLLSYKSQIDCLKEYKTILINQAVTGKIKVS